MPNFTIKFTKQDGTQGTYDLWANSQQEAIDLIARRQLPTMNQWVDWGIAPEQDIQQPQQAPQPATSPFIQVGTTGIPAPPIQKQSYQYYDENAQQLNSPEFASQQEADAWAQSQRLYKTYDEVFGWHTVQDPKTGLPKQVYGTIAQAKQYGTVTPKISTGDPKLDATLQGINSMMQNLISSGYQINPDVSIDEKALAEFTAIAEKEISPYYANNLKIARRTLLQQLGYQKEDIELLEGQLQRKYGTALRDIGETMAERGLAYSGQRKLAEEELATQTGETLSGALRTAQRTGTGLTQTFAQQYGTAQLPSTTGYGISKTIATPGEETFRKIGESPLYTLDESVYQGLIGEQQFSERAAKAKRKAELAGLTRELGGIEQVRKLL